MIRHSGSPLSGSNRKPSGAVPTATHQVLSDHLGLIVLDPLPPQ
jgi:hypothetical protein